MRITFSIFSSFFYSQTLALTKSSNKAVFWSKTLPYNAKTKDQGVKLIVNSGPFPINCRSSCFLSKGLTSSSVESEKCTNCVVF